MRTIKLLFTPIVLFTLLACEGSSETKVVRDTTTLSRSIDSLDPSEKGKDETIQKPQTSGIDTTKMSLKISSFKKVPAEIEGCGCYFSADKEKYKQKQYLFAATYDSVAYIMVDQKLIRLKMLSTTRKPDTFGDYDHIEIYSSENYKVTVDIKYKKESGDETWTNTGTITIESKQGQKEVKKFFGECGC